MSRFTAFALFIALLLSACQPPAANITSTPTLLSATRTAEPATATPVLPTQTQLPPTPTAAPLPGSTYTLQASLDYNRHTLSVDQTILYVYKEKEPVSELVLQVEANNQAGVFRLKSISLNGQVVNNAKLVGNHLDIPLDSPLTFGQNLRIALAFDLTLPLIPPPSNDSRSVIFGYSARQTNLVDWYPYVPARMGGKWMVHNPWFYGEHQVYETVDFEVAVELVNPPANLVIAASAEAFQEGNRYTYQHKKARNFTLSASNMYTVESQKVGDVTITSYAFPFDAHGGSQALKDAVDALQLYNRLFGTYPRSSLAVVEADFHDGMEYDGLYFLSRAFYGLYDGTPKGYLTAIGVHELAHQWWYALVGNDQALEPWLDETLSTYSELLFYEAVYPELVSWWWSTRVDYFNPNGWINLRIYDYSGAYPYRDAVYLNGAHFMADLRKAVGETTFLQFLKAYSATYANQVVTTADFFNLLATMTRVDLTSYKKPYFK